MKVLFMYRTVTYCMIASVYSVFSYVHTKPLSPSFSTFVRTNEGTVRIMSVAGRKNSRPRTNLAGRFHGRFLTPV